MCIRNDASFRRYSNLFDISLKKKQINKRIHFRAMATGRQLHALAMRAASRGGELFVKSRRHASVARSCISTIAIVIGK